MEAGRIVLFVIAFFSIALPIWVIMRVLSMFTGGKSKTYYIKGEVGNNKSNKKTSKRRTSNEMDFDDWGNGGDSGGGDD